MYKFKSRAAGDLIMLGPNGLQILQIIGKDDSPTPQQGILLPEEMPEALQALERAIAQDEQQRAEQIEEAKKNGESPPRFEAISLRLRAVPFMEMIKRCHQADKEIVWGV